MFVAKLTELPVYLHLLVRALPNACSATRAPMLVDGE
jgi:hypothetical protein